LANAALATHDHDFVLYIICAAHFNMTLYAGLAINPLHGGWYETCGFISDRACHPCRLTA
ncbi:MAG: hypothetical protein KAR25_05175, partial [Methanosarcinales archaeon]|nr:hypothetical protein [Methanosarcinales archaeon]